MKRCIFSGIFCLFAVLIAFSCDVRAGNQAVQNPSPVLAPTPIAASPYVRPDLADGYIKELRQIMRGKSYPAYQKFIISKIDARDYEILETYFSTLQDAYERNLIDDIELRYAWSTISDLPDLKYEPLFDEWVKQKPSSYVAKLASGQYHYDVAWEIRGTGYYDGISDNQYDHYLKELHLAQQAFIESLPMTKKPIISYFGLIGTNGETGSRLKGGRNVFDLLIEANKIDPQNFWARQQYLRFLTPQWGGSFATMKDFVELQKKNGLTQNKLDLLKSIIWVESAKSAFYYNKDDVATQEKMYRNAYQLQKPYKYLKIGQEGIKGLIRLKYNETNNGTVYSDEYFMLLDDLLKNSGNIEYVGYYHGLRGHMYVAKAVNSQNIEDFKDAFADFRAGAKVKDPYSMFRLASTYCEGFTGIAPQDENTCKSIMIEAGALGSEEAETVLRNRWGLKSESKKSEQENIGLTMAGKNVATEDVGYDLTEEEDDSSQWKTILFTVLQVIL